MFVGPNHPIFGDYRRSPSPSGEGPWGGDKFLPPMGAPPGARFDPVGLDPQQGDPTTPRKPADPERSEGGVMPSKDNQSEQDNDEFVFNTVS